MDISTAIVCCAAAILISLIIGKLFNWSSELILCCKIFSITIISHFAGTPTAILRLLNKFKLVSLDKFLSAFFELIGIGIYWFVYKNMTLLTSVWIFTISDFVGNIILVIFAYLEFKKTYIKYVLEELHIKNNILNIILNKSESEIVNLNLKL